MSMTGYAGRHCLSNFSVQRGASSADGRFRRARELGYEALAITDECTLAGIVRAWQAAKQHQLRLIVGSEVQVHDGPKLVLLVQDLAGYQNLCALITRARRRAAKGQYQLCRDDLQEHPYRPNALWVPEDTSAPHTGQWVLAVFYQRRGLSLNSSGDAHDAHRTHVLLARPPQRGLAAVG